MGRLIKGNSLNQHGFLYANYTSIKSLKEDTKIILQTSRPYWDLLAHLIYLTFYSYVSFHLLSSFIPVWDGSGILYHIHFEVMRPIRHCGLICTVWSSFLSSRFSAYCSRLPRVFFFYKHSYYQSVMCKTVKVKQSWFWVCNFDKCHHSPAPC